MRMELEAVSARHYTSSSSLERCWRLQRFMLRNRSRGCRDRRGMVYEQLVKELQYLPQLDGFFFGFKFSIDLHTQSHM